ncbi:hypothetical protein CPT_Morttis_120 [Acinetobacter phage Morttis]|nr:hypothetical protein CPT_Maestro_123 [Acinetobacter phage Maestro]QQM18613.1 hypothetical protein CPT_Morttis_120 [Acinetobacter phage Morttis]
MAGYHVTTIDKSTHLSPNKLVEEALEFVDALASNNKIMAQVELSDLFGAVKSQAQRLGVTIDDLDVMATTTANAFKSNGRPSFGTPSSLHKYLLDNATSVDEFDGGLKIWLDYNTYYMLFTRDKVSLPMQSESTLKDFTTVGEVVFGVVYVPHGKPYISAGNVFHRNDNTHYCAETKGTLVKFTRHEIRSPLVDKSRLKEALECLSLI